MKLYVWERFDPDWSDGLAFAIAETLEEAKGMIISKFDRPPMQWGSHSEFELDVPVAFCVSGES